jgi:hypothetical protein
MPTYGPSLTNPGFVPFSGFSPTLGVGDAITPATNGLVQFNGMGQEDNRLSRALYQGPNRVLRRLILTLLGTAAGSTATENRTRVQAQQSTFSPNDNGGLVPIETVATINRVTTSNDITNVTDALTRSYVPAYAADVSGNAGGGKLGF